MPAFEDQRGSRHRFRIERGPDSESGALLERTSRPIPDGVAVFPEPRRMAWVKTRWCPTNVADRDVRREEPIQGPGQLRCREAAGVGERDHLPAGMNPGVGSTRSVDRSPLASGEGRKRGLKFTLDRSRVCLDLESREISPIVFNGCSIANRHDLSIVFLVDALPAHPGVRASVRSLTHTAVRSVAYSAPPSSELGIAPRSNSVCL